MFFLRTSSCGVSAVWGYKEYPSDGGWGWAFQRLPGEQSGRRAVRVYSRLSGLWNSWSETRSKKPCRECRLPCLYLSNQFYGFPITYWTKIRQLIPVLMVQTVHLWMLLQPHLPWCTSFMYPIACSLLPIHATFLTCPLVFTPIIYPLEMPSPIQPTIALYIFACPQLTYCSRHSQSACELKHSNKACLTDKFYPQQSRTLNAGKIHLEMWREFLALSGK